FPFTDLSHAKMRPALVVSRTNHAGDDIIVCCITSTQKQHPCGMTIEPTKENGLKATSIVRFDKIVTVHSSIIRGKLGRVDRVTLQKYKEKFYDVFGFESASEKVP
ncbi:MAG: type II toxin-antitoxin system PemK/MazF family toxin, partial [Patescibacteria group bacterium]